MEKAMIIDYKYCTGCHVCEVACRNEHDYTLEEYGIKLAEFGPVKMGDHWMWNYVPVPSDLCDFCEARAERGEDPACVHHCLAQCIEVVDAQEASKRMMELGKTVTCFIP